MIRRTDLDVLLDMHAIERHEEMPIHDAVRSVASADLAGPSI